MSMSENDHKRAFWAILGRLRAAYPQRTTEDEWRVTVRRYFEELQGYSLEAVAAACDRAWRPDVYPRFFPTLGELTEIVQHFERAMRAQPSKRLTDGTRFDGMQPETKRIVAELVKKFGGGTDGQGTD